MRALLIKWLRWLAAVLHVPEEAPLVELTVTPLPLLTMDLGKPREEGRPRLAILIEDFEQVVAHYGPYRRDRSGYFDTTTCFVSAYIERVWVEKASGWVEYRAAEPVPAETLRAEKRRLQIGYAARRAYINSNGDTTGFGQANYHITELVVRLLKASDAARDAVLAAQEVAAHRAAMKTRADELFGTPTPL
jgi:hypothetical protein